MGRKKSAFIREFARVALLVLILSSSVSAATLTVTSNADSGAGTLRNQVAAAASGDTVNFSLAYPATITLTSGPIVIDKNLTISGPGASSLTVSGNNASRVFGIIAGVTANIQDITVANGNSVVGGGIYNAGTLTVTNSTISGNSAGDPAFGGGGIYNAGTLTVTNSTISGNTAIGGGGIYNYNSGTLVVMNSAISGNSAYMASGAGGGIYNDGNMTVTNSTISGNTVGIGGGIYSNGRLTVTNSTISGNSAGQLGGGIANYSIGDLTVTSCTISGNSANIGGGIYNIGSVAVTNSIVATNTAPSGVNCWGAVTDGGNNIDDANTCGFTNPTSMSNTDPLLDPAGLQDNGGPTQTIALLAGSPAINAGAICPADDQRGIARPQGASCDIGAYEFVPATTTAIVSSLNPSNYGDSVTFTATVSDSEAASTPTGSVTFKDGGTDIAGCVSVALTGASADCTLSTLNGGGHAITAEYTSNGGFDSSVSGGLTQNVNQASSFTTVGTSGSPSVYGQTVIFTATVTSGATGTVAFTEGATTYCAASPVIGNSATCSTSALGVGPHTITAIYSGDVNYNGSVGTVGQTVNRAGTTTSITSQSAVVTAVGQSFTVGYSVSVTAPGSGTTTGNVIVSDGVNSCTGTAAAGTCTITLTTVGLRTLTATYSGDANFTGSVSAGTAHTVNQAATTTTITAHTPDPSAVGQAVAVSYTVTVVAPGSGTPTGNVTVSDGVDSCTATAATGSCSITLTTAGTRTLTATYVGDTNFTGSASAGEPHDVCISAITVTNTNDSGLGSLRQAIADICAGGTIDFNLTYPATITLTSGELWINKDMTIAGPGAANLTISGNNVTRIFYVNTGVVVIIQDVAISNGRGGYGGGIYNQSGILSVIRSVISENNAVGGNGGGVWSDGVLVIDSCEVLDNSAVWGGGIHNEYGTVTITNSTVSRNIADWVGGGIRSFSGTLTVTNSTISRNSARNGGGVTNGAGSLTVTNSTVSENSARDSGGIYNSGIMTLTNSTISDNTAINFGGGIYSINTSLAIREFVINCTISGNSANSIGGLLSAGVTMSLSNSIVTANAGGNCFAPLTDGGGNIEDGTACGFGASSLSNTDPLLDPAGLKDNGGPTQTIALLPGSPAIDAGAGCPTTDQRGIARPQGAGCDIGAFESQGFTFGTPTGTPQSTAINTAFGAPLGVSVISAFGEPVDGGIITFTAPSSGPSTTFAPTTTAKVTGGSASLGVTANGTAGGPYTVTASGIGVAGTALFNLTNSQVLTTTSIIAHPPDPSTVGQSVTVTYTVAVGAPGSGTPTGNVTVSDGVDSCTGTAAAGSCSLTLTTPGTRTLTATYAGDANFMSSSGTASHTVLYQYLLSVTKSGSGTVTGNITGVEGSGINCGTDCTETYNHGTVVTLTARPSTGWLFDSWSGSCTGTAACSVTMDAAKSVTATFVEDTSPAITGINAMAYMPLPYAIAHQVFEETRPIGIGPYAEGRDRVSVNAGMKGFSEPVDLYLVLRFPTTEPQEYYLLNQDYTFTTLSEGIAPWKSGCTGAVDENLFGIISGSELPSGTYELYMMAAPTGRTDSYRIWETAFDVPFDGVMPLPAGGRWIVQEPNAFPARSTDPGMANPIGLGSAAVDAQTIGLSDHASMGETIDLRVGLEGFDGPADIYVGVYLPDTEPDTLWLLRSDGVFQKLSHGLAAWKTGYSGVVDEIPVEGVPVSILPKGRYFFYLVATPQDRLDTWYLWESMLLIP